MKATAFLMALSALATPVAAFAQATPASVAPLAAPAPVDPLRLAAAKPVIDRIWPLGTYARIMRGSMDQIMNASMSGMYGLKASDVVPPRPSATGAVDPLAGKTMGEAMRASDPYFEQRMQRTMHVMTEEMARLMTEIEPDVRSAMAKSYARRFSVSELGDLDRFFATPTGAAYAHDSMMLMMGPDMVQAMQAFVPKLMKEMPAIMAKAQDATKDLPPPPTKKPVQ